MKTEAMHNHYKRLAAAVPPDILTLYKTRPVESMRDYAHRKRCTMYEAKIVLDLAGVPNPEGRTDT